MAETGAIQLDRDISQSWDVARGVWPVLTPDQLIQDGYAEHVGFTPKHGQITDSADTKIGEESLDSEAALTSTGSDKGLIINLSAVSSIPMTLQSATMQALQEWEGFVLEEREEEFLARLRDLTVGRDGLLSGETDEQEAIIPLSELSADDLRKVRPGSVFRWVIGYERLPSGTKRRVSQIVFRDLPALTEQDWYDGREWASRILQSVSDGP